MRDPLTDTFGRSHTYLRLSLTERCNLRCTYCMPAEGVPLRPKTDILTFEELVRLSRLFATLGIRKIRLTGGEPLVRKEVEQLATRLAAIEGIEELAITTNGLLLESKLDRLMAAGVTHLNISLDTLRHDRFVEVTRRPGLEKVLRAIDKAVECGYNPVKINCVVLKGFNDDELVDFVELGRDRPLDLRFIEFMPFGGNEWSTGEFISYRAMRDIVLSRYELEQLGPNENQISKGYRVPGFAGTVGFISSMSDDFCSGCNRLRVTADGNLKVCLFGQSEVSLRDAMRSGQSDSDLEALIRASVQEKKASHDGMFAIAAQPGRPMILIGG
jgi:cyclic pyranopterin phosphate synthase